MNDRPRIEMSRDDAFVIVGLLELFEESCDVDADIAPLLRKRIEVLQQAISEQSEHG